MISLEELGLTSESGNVGEEVEHTYKNKERGNQLVVFNGLSHGKYGHTDIDAAQELFGKYLILVEVKYGDKELNRGQKLFIKNTTDRWVEINEAHRLFWTVMCLVEKETGLNGLELLERVKLMDPTLDISLFSLLQNKEAIGIRVSHNVEVPNEIELKDCVVEEIYSNGKWVEVVGNQTYGEFYQDLIINKWKIPKK